MKPEHIIAVLVRLFAIALILVVVRDMIAALWVVDDSVYLRKYAYIFLFGGAVIFISIILLKFPLSVAKRIYPFRLEDEPKHSLNSDDFYHLGFILLGVYLLFYVLSDGVFWIAFTLYSGEEKLYSPLVSLENKASMITTVVELFIALFLILGAKGITNTIKAIRK